MSGFALLKAGDNLHIVSLIVCCHSTYSILQANYLSEQKSEIILEDIRYCNKKELFGICSWVTSKIILVKGNVTPFEKKVFLQRLRLYWQLLWFNNFFFQDKAYIISDVAWFPLDKWMSENGKGSFSKPEWQFSYYAVMWIKCLPFWIVLAQKKFGPRLMKSTKIMFVSLDILLTFLNGLSDLFPEIISFLI